MSAVDIGLDDFQIAAYHFQRGMTQAGLERVDVAAVAQEVDGKCMAESMGRGARDTGTVPGALDEEAQRLARETLANVVREQGIIAVEVGIAFCGQIAPHAAGGPASGPQYSLFGPLAHHFDAVVIDVGIGDGEAAELRGAHAGIEQSTNDGLIAEGCGPRVGRERAVRQVGAGVLAGVQHCDALRAGVGVDGALFRFGARDGADDVLGDGALTLCPGPQRGEGNVNVEEALFAERFGRARDESVLVALWFVPKVIEQTPDVVSSDLADRWIPG